MYTVHSLFTPDSLRILTVSLHLHISRRTLSQLVGGCAAVGPCVSPGDHSDVQHWEVAQNSPVSILAPRDLSLGVCVHLALEGDGVVTLHYGVLRGAGHRHIGGI